MRVLPFNSIESPKSVILTYKFAISTKKFWGFISLWIILNLWRSYIQYAVSNINLYYCYIVKSLYFLSKYTYKSPSNNSSNIYKVNSASFEIFKLIPLNSTIWGDFIKKHLISFKYSSLN